MCEGDRANQKVTGRNQLGQRVRDPESEVQMPLLRYSGAASAATEAWRCEERITL